MKSNYLVLVLINGVFLVPHNLAADEIAAFPGAEGPGAHTPGGRGGSVYLVTTLEDYLPGKEKSIPGSLRSAVALEAQRLRRQGVSPWNPKTYLSNDVLNAWAMSVVLWGVLIAVFGPALIPFVIIQAAAHN